MNVSPCREHIAEPFLIASAPSMKSVLTAATRVASGQTKVLITGESGVGKDVIARYIHARSPRAHAPFVAVNCAGLSETLLESELFGHTRGSFTGAHRDKMGRLQLAHRGTIFLDEVGEMSQRMQALSAHSKRSRISSGTAAYPPGLSSTVWRLSCRRCALSRRRR